MEYTKENLTHSQHVCNMKHELLLRSLQHCTHTHTNTTSFLRYTCTYLFVDMRPLIPEAISPDVYVI